MKKYLPIIIFAFAFLTLLSLNLPAFAADKAGMIEVIARDLDGNSVEVPIYVDGKIRGRGKASIKVPAGRHVVKFKKKLGAFTILSPKKGDLEILVNPGQTKNVRAVYRGEELKERFNYFSVDYEYFPYAKPRKPRSGTFEEDLKTSVKSWNIHGAYPWVLAGGNTVLVFGMDYKRLTYEYKNWDLTQDPDLIENLHGLRSNISITQKITPNWSLQTFAQPGTYSDFEQLSTSDFQIDGGALLNRRLGPNFIIGLGGVYTHDFGNSLFLPLLKASYQAGQNFRVELFLPSRGEIWYSFGDRYEVGLKAGVSGGKFQLGKSGLQIDELRYSEGAVGPSVRVRIHRGLYAFAEGGYTFYRRYETFSVKNEARSLNLNNIGFMRAGIFFGS